MGHTGPEVSSETRAWQRVPQPPSASLYSHVRVLERGRRWIEREPGGWFHWRVGEIQLQSFTFT